MKVGGLPEGSLPGAGPYRPQVTVGVGYILPGGSVGVVRVECGEVDKVGGLGSWGQGAVGGWRV